MKLPLHQQIFKEMKKNFFTQIEAFRCSQALKNQPSQPESFLCIKLLNGQYGPHVRTHVRGELAGADDLEEPDPALGAGHHLLSEQVPGAEVLHQSEVSIAAT